MAESENNSVPILSRLSPPEGAVRKKRRKGRGPGSGLGKTSGKGMKGAKARNPGGLGKLGFEGGQTPLYRRLPKRGFHNLFSKKVVTLNLRDLLRFDAGSTVDPEVLKSAGLVKRSYDGIKILDGSMHAGVDIVNIPDGIKLSLESYLSSMFSEIDVDNSIPLSCLGNTPNQNNRARPGSQQDCRVPWLTRTTV